MEEIRLACERLIMDAKLNERETQILRMRFGLDTGSPMLLEDVGKLMKYTRERVRQIEAKALRKMREQIKSRELESYYRLIDLLPWIRLTQALTGHSPQETSMSNVERQADIP